MFEILTNFWGVFTAIMGESFLLIVSLIEDKFLWHGSPFALGR